MAGSPPNALERRWFAPVGTPRHDLNEGEKRPPKAFLRSNFVGCQSRGLKIRMPIWPGAWNCAPDSASRRLRSALLRTSRAGEGIAIPNGSLCSGGEKNPGSRSVAGGRRTSPRASDGQAARLQIPKITQLRRPGGSGRLRRSACLRSPTIFALDLRAKGFPCARWPKRCRQASRRWWAMFPATGN